MLYWQYETSISPRVNISLRGDASLPKSVYNAYLKEFINKFEDKQPSCGETSIIYPNNRSEYVTIVSLIIPFHERIWYPGYQGSDQLY